LAARLPRQCVDLLGKLIRWLGVEADHKQGRDRQCDEAADSKTACLITKISRRSHEPWVIERWQFRHSDEYWQGSFHRFLHSFSDLWLHVWSCRERDLGPLRAPPRLRSVQLARSCNLTDYGLVARRDGPRPSSRWLRTVSLY